MESRHIKPTNQHTAHQTTQSGRRTTVQTACMHKMLSEAVPSSQLLQEGHFPFSNKIETEHGKELPELRHLILLTARQLTRSRLREQHALVVGNTVQCIHLHLKVRTALVIPPLKIGFRTSSFLLKPLSVQSQVEKTQPHAAKLPAREHNQINTGTALRGHHKVNDNGGFDESKHSCCHLWMWNGCTPAQSSLLSVQFSCFVWAMGHYHSHNFMATA